MRCSVCTRFGRDLRSGKREWGAGKSPLMLEKISASFGVSLFPRHGKTSAELLHQAELALGSAKEFGNNRVQVASAGKEQD